MKLETVDFGGPKAFGIHHFYVEIPRMLSEPISIYEDFGLDTPNPEESDTECRLILNRELWRRICEDARYDFNTRLKAAKQTTGKWTCGKVRLDRFLGSELCVLGWATELASIEECGLICKKWLALRPEERWFFYNKTVAGSGKAEQSNRGWRKAIYCALSDGEGVRLPPPIARKKSKVKPSKNRVIHPQPSMFTFNDKEEE